MNKFSEAADWSDALRNPITTRGMKIGSQWPNNVVLKTRTYQGMRKGSIENKIWGPKHHVRVEPLESFHPSTWTIKCEV